MISQCFSPSRGSEEAGVLQEVAVAKTVHLRFGNICMDWESFARILPIVFHPCIIRFLRSRGSDPSQYTAKLPMTGARAASQMAGCRERTQNRSHMTLDEVLGIGIVLESTKAQDKIYALLGLATDGSIEQIKPDYEKSVEQLFTETMRFLLRTGDPLYTLHLAGTGTMRKYELPSWVPD